MVHSIQQIGFLNLQEQIGEDYVSYRCLQCKRPGVYLHSKMNNQIVDDIIYMLLEGKLAELMVMIDPKLYHQTINKNGSSSYMYI